MHTFFGRCAIVLVACLACWRCGTPTPQPPPSSSATPQTPAPPADDADPAEEEAAPPRNARTAEVLAKLMPSNATGCAPGARCIRVTGSTGRPQPGGASVAQCRGELADFVVPRSTIPAGYSGPWFTPHLIEQAHTGIPSGTRPWRTVDPRVESQRLAYLLTLRNYAFASEPVRSYTPQLTADADYFDSTGASVPPNQRTQKWYTAPRMTYGSPSSPGSREAARGMTLERNVNVNELGENTVSFGNYAVAYYDARGARTFARAWNTDTPGIDTPVRSMMRFTNGSLVYKLLFSAARPSDFPHDLLAGSLAVDILPNSGGAPVNVRLLQIDIAVKDDRAGATGWYFATYAYDRNAPGTSPWLKMVPVGLMWGNDPNGSPLVETWINPGAPAYAKSHLGVDGRLNGPVDNRLSACMSCHATAQAPAVANILPPAGGACGSQRAAWFRNLPGTQPFGRFDPEGSTCETSLNGITLTAADYSLQLGATVSRAVDATQSTFNPCTWDDAHVPTSGPTMKTSNEVRVFPVTRDPAER